MESQSWYVLIIALGAIAVHGNEFVNALKGQVVGYGNTGSIQNLPLDQLLKILLQPICLSPGPN